MYKYIFNIFSSIKFVNKNCVKNQVARTRRLRRYFESLFDGGDGTIKVGITSGKYAAEDTVEKHVRLLVGKFL